MICFQSLEYPKNDVTKCGYATWKENGGYCDVRDRKIMLKKQETVVRKFHQLNNNSDYDVNEEDFPDSHWSIFDDVILNLEQLDILISDLDLKLKGQGQKTKRDLNNNVEDKTKWNSTIYFSIDNDVGKYKFTRV